MLNRNEIYVIGKRSGILFSELIFIAEVDGLDTILDNTILDIIRTGHLWTNDSVPFLESWGRGRMINYGVL